MPKFQTLPDYIREEYKLEDSKSAINQIHFPKDFKELEDMLEFAVNLGKPVVIRYPRGGEDITFDNKNDIKIELCAILPFMFSIRSS